MRSTFAALVLFLAPAALVLAAPAPNALEQLSVPNQLRMGLDAVFGSDDDICPSLVVRCIKDGDITQVIGDIGEQSFCKKGVTCRQCHSKKNSAECNLKYLKDCAAKCEGYGSPV